MEIETTPRRQVLILSQLQNTDVATISGKSVGEPQRVIWIDIIRVIDSAKMKKLLTEARHSFANEDVQYQKDNYQKFVTNVLKRFLEEDV